MELDLSPLENALYGNSWAPVMRPETDQGLIGAAAAALRDGETERKRLKEALARPCISCGYQSSVIKLASQPADPVAVDLLREVFKLLDDRVLVRNIEHDHEDGWAMKQLPLVLLLARIKACIEHGPPTGGAA